MSEEWKVIEDFPGYEISDQGNVRVWKSKGYYRDVSQHFVKEDGYRRVNLWSAKEGHTKRLVHVLVCKAFNGPPPSDGKLYQVNHKDGVKYHNASGNLEWETGSGNVQHALENGLTNYNLQITACDTETGQVVSFHSMEAAARALGSTPEAIKRLLGHPDKPKYKDKFILSHNLSEHRPAHKTEDKIVAIDHVLGTRLVSENVSTMSILTGVLRNTILNALKKCDLSMVAGYTFKWFKDLREVPAYTVDQALDSRVKYFSRKAYVDCILAKHHPTGIEYTFASGQEAVRVTGVCENTIRTFINGGSVLPFKGYSFKRPDNDTPFPVYDEDQKQASLIRKSRGAVPYKVLDTYTGQVDYYPSLKDVASFFGWARSALRSWIDKYPKIPYMARWIVEPIIL